MNIKDLTPFLHLRSIESASIIKKHFRTSLNVESKSDSSPVTIADKLSEEKMREFIKNEFPDHGIVGEEFGKDNPDAEYVWVLDPIDGTQNLINLIPTFGTLIGLRYKGKAIIGIIDHPVLNTRVNGGIGLGVFHNNFKITLGDLKNDSLSPNDIIATNSPAVFGETIADKELFTNVLSFHPHSRIYYDCYDQTLAVLGRLAVVVEPNLKIWDITPLEALLSELGGRCIRFNERGNGSSMLVNAIFGKTKAVDLMCKHLGH